MTTSSNTKTSKQARIHAKNLSPLELKSKCAECVHFDNKAHADFKRPCKELGIKAYAKVCDKYNPNVARMARTLGALEAVTDLIAGMDESDMRLFLYSAMNASKISKNTKFSYGEKVYFNLSAPYVEFIDSYYSGVVIAFIQGDENSEDGYLQIAGSLTGGTGSSIILPVSSLLTEKAWVKLYKKLLAENRFFTPTSNRLRVNCSEPTNPDDYIVPTLDDKDTDLEQRATKQQRGKAKANHPALDTYRSGDDFDDETNGNGDEPKQRKSKNGSGNSTKMFSY
jgi:hypothetical protein